MKNLKIDHLNISVKDLDKTTLWYERVFGFKAVEQGVRQGIRWKIIRNGDTMLCLNEHKSKKMFSQAEEDVKNINLINHFSLRINSSDEWQAVMDKEDLEYSYTSPTQYPHSTSWYVFDPNGIEIEVTHWKNDEISFS